MANPATARLLTLAGIGGFLGTILRYGVTQVFETAPIGTLTVNLLGAAALGLLLGWNPWRKKPGANSAQAFLGTGLLGGFTTYSALALDAITLPGFWAFGYAAATLIFGIGAAAGGILLGRYLQARPTPGVGP